jgi:hypothetical protein
MLRIRVVGCECKLCRKMLAIVQRAVDILGHDLRRNAGRVGYVAILAGWCWSRLRTGQLARQAQQAVRVKTRRGRR